MTTDQNMLYSMEILQAQQIRTVTVVTSDYHQLRGQALLDAVCYGRGFLLKGNEPDEERGCRVVLEEFRSGKLGRITLERP